MTSESGTTLNVRMWALRVLKRGRRRYGVRWVTAGEEHSEWYQHRTQADNRRSDLLQAMRRGEPFDIASGLPVSELQVRNEVSLLEYAQGFLDQMWKAAPAQTRKTRVDNLAVAVTGFVRDLDNPPDVAVLRRVLTTRLLPVNMREEPVTLEQQAAASWIKRASRPITDLRDRSTVRQLLFSPAMTTNLDGRSAAASTVEKRRLVLHLLLGDAVESGLLDFNPLSGLTGKPSAGGDVTVDEVDPRVVPNPKQARQLLAAVTYIAHRLSLDRGQRLYAFFACLYFGGLRPGEALGLHEEDCVLPTAKLAGRGNTGGQDWGELVLCRSFSASNTRYTDNGRVHENRSLKRRARREIRRVPIPPELVVILREHLARFGTAADGRLFWGVKSGGGVPASVYNRVWHEARTIGLPPQQAASPLALRPYDLRHAAVSTWLNGGADPAEVAARAGHSVAVLLKIYAKCVDGQRDAINRKIQRVLDGEIDYD